MVLSAITPLSRKAVKMCRAETPPAPQVEWVFRATIVIDPLNIFMSYPAPEDRLTRSAETDELRPFNLAEFIVQRLEAVGVSAILLQVPEDSAPKV